MDQIYKLSCKCGYKKELSVGDGGGSFNLDVVNSLFTEEKLRAFNNYYKEKKVKSFFLENIPCFCDECEEIIAVAALKFQLTNGVKFKIVNSCPVCSSRIQVLDDNWFFCPKCGEAMNKEEVRNRTEAANTTINYIYGL